ncbi:hypothetical protein LX32DRAFT_698955 [Colletotrichum zoysiae]|uniref:Uncharacterized protein n=1 Tax=Colletotrichum zoysiae TaxID=1216348 RepID=A0AAD9H592_9PEZI|nr:hypothetical protein LX32DRAFT_698955 [Colletotrichum zoysiae]
MARKFTSRIRGRWSEIAAKAKAIFTKPRWSLQKKTAGPQATNTCISHGGPMFLHPNAPLDCLSTAAVHTSEEEHREPSVFEECLYCNGDRESDTDSWTSEVFSEDSDPDSDMDHHKCQCLQDDTFLVDSNPFTTPGEI